MKLIRNATTAANPDLRGRKHHFTIENAPAATLEAMDNMLTAAGWNNDGCPCYDDGFGCGWWIDLSEVDQFKVAYKEAKAGVKEFMAQPVAPAEFEITIKGSVGVDNLFHPGDVVYCGSKLHMKAVVTTLPKIGDVIPATDLMGEYDARVKVREILNDCPPRPAHLQAARDAHHNELYSGFFNDRVKPTEARKHELEDMSDDQIYVAFAVAPVVSSDEINAAHSEALKMDEEITFVREMESLTAEQAMAYVEQWAYSNADIATQKLMFERDHIEALSINDKVDTDLAILRSDIQSFRREHTGARLEEVIDYAIRHTFNRIVQVYGVEIHRDFFADLSSTPEQKAFSGGMKAGANTDISTPLRIISDYMQRFMRNNKDAKLSEAKQRLESKIVLLIDDGYDEQHLRQALSAATSSHSREAFTRAISI